MIVEILIGKFVPKGIVDGSTKGILLLKNQNSLTSQKTKNNYNA